MRNCPQVFAIKFKNVNLNGVLYAVVWVIKGFLVKILQPSEMGFGWVDKGSGLCIWISMFCCLVLAYHTKALKVFQLFFVNFLIPITVRRSFIYVCLPSSTLQSTWICKLIDGLFKVKVLKASVNTRLCHIHLVFHTLSLHTYTLWRLTVLISNYLMLLTRTSHNIYLFVRKWTVKKSILDIITMETLQPPQSNRQDRMWKWFKCDFKAPQRNKKFHSAFILSYRNNRFIVQVESKSTSWWSVVELGREKKGKKKLKSELKPEKVKWKSCHGDLSRQKNKSFL